MWNELVIEFIDRRGGDWNEKTLRWYRRRLNVFVAWAETQALAPEQLDAAELLRFRGHMKRLNFKWTTRRGTLTALKTLVRWLYRHKRLSHNPFDDPDYRPLPRERQVKPMISLSHAQRMIRAAEKDGSTAGSRDAAIMRLLLTAGLRRAEVARLAMKDINFEARAMVVAGKFGHQRAAPLRVTTHEALKRWLAVRPQTADPALFVSLVADKRGLYHGLAANAINNLLIRWRDAAGLPPISVSSHKWRRRFATELAKAGNPFALQDLMGHSDISTTNEYVINDADTLRGLIDEYGPDIDDPPD